MQYVYKFYSHHQGQFWSLSTTVYRTWIRPTRSRRQSRSPRSQSASSPTSTTNWACHHPTPTTKRITCAVKMAMNTAWPSVPQRTHSTPHEMAVRLPISRPGLTPCTISKMVSDPGLLRMTRGTPWAALKSKCTAQARLSAWLPTATTQMLQARAPTECSRTLASTAPPTPSITSNHACFKRNLCLWARIVGARVSCSPAV